MLRFDVRVRPHARERRGRGFRDGELARPTLLVQPFNLRNHEERVRSELLPEEQNLVHHRREHRTQCRRPERSKVRRRQRVQHRLWQKLKRQKRAKQHRRADKRKLARVFARHHLTAPFFRRLHASIRPSDDAERRHGDDVYVWFDNHKERRHERERERCVRPRRRQTLAFNHHAIGRHRHSSTRARFTVNRRSRVRLCRRTFINF